MAEFEPKNADFEQRVRDSFAEQGIMQALGIELKFVQPGTVSFSMPYNATFSQQHGFVHAGVIATALDSACGYAAFSLMPEDAEVLTAEFKINLIAPADGDSFSFTGTVIKPGRTLSFAEGTAIAHKDGRDRKVATMMATLMAITGRPGINS